MRGWLLDTNVVSEIMRPAGLRRVVAWAEAQDESRLYISVVTLAEYDKGIHKLPEKAAARTSLEALIRSLEERMGNRSLPLSDAIVRRWGRMSGVIQRTTGKAPQVIDALLAATAIEHNLYLATQNVKDMRRCGAVVFNPWRDDPGAFPLAT
jgi:hypothetical protein